MKDTNGARAATDEHPGAPKVAPRFTRAVNAERSRLEGKRAQLLLKREAAQAELGRIDRAVQATDELLELLAPLLAANGNEPEAAGEDSGAEADRGTSASERRRGACARSRTALIGPRCERRPSTTSEGVRNDERTKRARHAPATTVRRRRGADGRRRRDRRHGPAGAAERARADLRRARSSSYAAVQGGRGARAVRRRARRGDRGGPPRPRARHCGSRRTRDDARRESRAATSCSATAMGRVFYAIVVERHERELEVDPIDRRVTYRRVKAREVLGIWRKSRAQNGRVVEALRPAS